MTISALALWFAESAEATVRLSARRTIVERFWLMLCIWVAHKVNNMPRTYLSDSGQANRVLQQTLDRNEPRIFASYALIGAILSRWSRLRGRLVAGLPRHGSYWPVCPWGSCSASITWSAVSGAADLRATVCGNSSDWAAQMAARRQLRSDTAVDGVERDS